MGVSMGCKKASAGEEAGVRYFLVSEKRTNHGDSFILPLTDPVHIQAAERIISSGSFQIVSARINYGNGDGSYVNRDLLDPGKRSWSWHVVEFSGFYDLGAEIYDSWPTYIEENLDEWMQMNDGRIGFWSYTVTRKVAASEVK